MSRIAALVGTFSKIISNYLVNRSDISQKREYLLVGVRYER